MKIFLYEFVTGGGWYSFGAEPCPGSLVREGRAMVEALGSDLLKVDDVSLDLLHDQHLPTLEIAGAQIHPVETRFQELAAFRKLAADADWTIVIAPEIAGFLAQRASMVEKIGGRLLGPSLETIRLSSDKHSTAEFLASQGVRTPKGIPLERGTELPAEFSFPAVLKPRDGAGSMGVRVINSIEQIGTIDQPLRLEEFCPGKSVSVLFVCGPEGNVPLIPCSQTLSDDGTFAYLGGALPLEKAAADRATRLASQAVATLERLHGFVGVDLVLGNSADGSEDTVIEINARLTTSYVGLRAVSEVNLAECLLQAARGEAPHFAWNDRQVQFDATGRVW